MKVKFDALNRFEAPKMYLCNPGCVCADGVLSSAVGCLSDTTDEELVLNFNSTSELNFRIYRILRDNSELNSYISKTYRTIQNRRLIFVEDVGFFVITEVNDGYSDGLHYKDIRAKSCEVEIQNKMLVYIADGTYPFASLLNTIVSALPIWTVGFIDEDVSARERTFMDVNPDTNTLAFMINEMQKAYECIFVFNTITRQIDVYDQDNYVNATQIHITKDDVINSIGVTENSDDLYTAISVFGDEDLNIVPVNPLGSNVIYNFDYYLDWMSPSLKSRVQSWKSAVESSTTSYHDLNLQYYTKLTERSNLESELERLNTQISMYQKCRENIVADGDTSSTEEYNNVLEKNGGATISTDKEIEETLAEIDNRLSSAQSSRDNVLNSIESVNSEIGGLEDQIGQIRDQVAIDSYFTEAEYNELYHYIFEGSYRDEYVTVTDIMTYEEKFDQMKTLYDRAVDQLKKVSTPTQEFSVDVENFIFEKSFEKWSDQLETGCLINVELDENDVAELFLCTITVNYDDRSLRLTFGNRFNKFDPKSLFDNALGNIQKTANTIDYIRDIIQPITNGELNYMREALQTSRDLTMDRALASTNQEVVIDGSGYTGRQVLDNGLYDPHQIKITGNNIVFTDDSWNSCKLAIGELRFGENSTAYGINAEVIIGDMILGNNLRILDNDGNDMFTVIDGLIQSSIGDIDEKLTQIEQTNEYLTIKVQEIDNKNIDSVTTTTGYTFDADGLKISKSGEEMINMLDNTGMYVTRSGETILQANNDGVVATDVKVRNYLIIGEHARFEDYSDGVDENRTACFFVS